MSDYRIVHNEQTNLYRVERRGWTGWTFVRDAQGGDYATFVTCEDARRFVCRQRRRASAPRRWEVIDLCSRRCAGD